MSNKTILEIHNDLINKKYSIEDMVNNFVKKIEYYKFEKKDNVFLYLDLENSIKKAKELDQNLDDNKDNLLYGICGTLKDNIVVKDQVSTGGSRFLEHYISPFSASVVNDLIKSNSILLAKVNNDELGFGGTGLYSGFGIIKNPIDENHITAGSSSGSAVSVYNGTCSYSNGTDTGDSIRAPANFLGLVGFKPSYGVISRYGVIPFASSMDHVGIIANDVTDIAILMDAIAKHDKNDFSSIELINKEFFKSLNHNLKPKFAIIKDSFDLVDENIKEEYFNFLKKLESNFDISYVNFGEELIKIIPAIYKTTTTVEGISNVANLNGITFGNRDGIDYLDFKDLAIKTRSKYLGKELIKRILIGAYLSSEDNFESIYLKSIEIRNILINRANEILSKYDAFIIPGGSNTAPLIDDVLNYKQYSTGADNMLQIANFGGFPSISIPLDKKNSLPFGINITAKKYDDQKVINIAYILEKFIKDLK